MLLGFELSDGYAFGCCILFQHSFHVSHLGIFFLHHFILQLFLPLHCALDSPDFFIFDPLFYFYAAFQIHVCFLFLYLSSFCVYAATDSVPFLQLNWIFRFLSSQAFSFFLGMYTLMHHMFFLFLLLSHLLVLILLYICIYKVIL